MVRNLVIFGFCLHFLILPSCSWNKKQSGKTEVKIENKKISFSTLKSVNIFCWCFSLFPYQFFFEKDGRLDSVKDYLGKEVSGVSNCEAPISLTKEDIVRSSNFLSAITL